jgi:lipopolysaccharide export system permease protein
MKIIHKAIIRELTLTFILSLVSLNFILMMEKLIKLSRFLSGVGTSIIDMARLIAYLQPQLLLLTIPMALLLSTLIVYGRLNMDNELVILRISGMNFRGISVPVAVFGLFCFAFNLAVSFYIGPKSSMQLRSEIADIIKERTPLAIEEGNFNTSFKDITIFVKHKPAENLIRGVFMYDGRDKNEPRILVAKEGQIFTREGFAINFLLKDGSIHIAKGENTTEIYFDTYNMVLSLEAESPAKRNAELTPSELIQRIEQSRKHVALSLYLELYRRFSLPLMCIIIIFFGPPLALIAGKAGKLGGLTVGLTVFTVYYLLLVYGENLARASRIPHSIGAWGATVVLALFAFIMYRKESSR